MGYIKLHRKIQDSDLWAADPANRISAWIDLLFLASHNDYRTIIKNQPVQLHRGDLVISKRFLMKRWKWGSSKTLAFIDMLSKSERITKIRPGTGPLSVSIYHIVNYDAYQGRDLDSQTASQTDSRPVADRLQTETKNQKNQKKKEDGLFSSSGEVEIDRENLSLAAGSPKAGTNGQQDIAYESFQSAFLDRRKVPYQKRAADFVQLAGLRKTFGISKPAEPANWIEAIGNYFDSPQSRYTLADLCTRYDTFIAGPVDRFGKPDVPEEDHWAKLKRGGK